MWTEEPIAGLVMTVPASSMPLSVVKVQSTGISPVGVSTSDRSPPRRVQITTDSESGSPDATPKTNGSDDSLTSGDSKSVMVVVASGAGARVGPGAEPVGASVADGSVDVVEPALSGRARSVPSLEQAATVNVADKARKRRREIVIDAVSHMLCCRSVAGSTFPVL